MRALVTGGAGFIGSHVVDQLVMQGAEVRVLDSLAPSAHAGMPAYLNPGADYRFCDLRDHEAVLEAVAGVDAVSHQAARVGLGTDFADVSDYVADNDAGTATLLRALFGTGFRGHLVLASSMVIYGEGAYSCSRHGRVHPGPRTVERLGAGCYDPPCPRCGQTLRPELVDEGQGPSPTNVYAATKLHQEHLCHIYGREAGVPVTCLRYHNVYGPRMPSDTPYAGVASIFRSLLSAGRAPLVFEDGGQRRDFVHVSDVARANLAALRADPPVSGPFNVASGEVHTVAEMARALAVAFPGAPDAVITGRYRLADVRHVTASPRRAREQLGFRATVPFAEGMRELAGAELRAPVRP